MPALPVLQLIRSLPPSEKQSHPTERIIERQTLLDVAPDREALLLETRSIEEIRQAIRVRTADDELGHWLYKKHERKNVKLKDRTRRLSLIQHHRERDSLRRCLSATDLNPLLSTGIEARLFSLGSPQEVWSKPYLSTLDKLVSPRPLGPTHLLVLYDQSPARSGVYASVVECPVNDLIVMANMPNIPTGFRFPPRVPKELPKVMIHVRHLETFPELLVFLHTKNQAELFRGVLLQWLRDLLHPLPSVPDIAAPPSTATIPTKTKNKKESSPPVRVERTIESIAKDIANEARALNIDPHTFATISAKINVLRDNVDDIGYYGETLWQELDVTWKILIRALTLLSQVTGTVSV